MARIYRPARTEELRALVLTDAQAFGDATDAANVDRSTARSRLEEFRVLEEDGTRLGLLIARGHRVFWGGRALPAGQVSGVSVGLEHRGRGVAGELMRGYLSEAHERGLAISTLFPATVPLYRRLGYEYSGTWTLYEAAARHLPNAWPDGYRAFPIPIEEDLTPLKQRFEAVAPGRSGQVERDDDWWRNRLLRDRGNGPPEAFLIDGPDGPNGWAILKADNQMRPTGWSMTVEVRDWGATSPDGWRSLLALVAGHASLDATVTWTGPEPEPLAVLLRQQDLRQARQFRWMTRIVDVQSAFGGRGYPPDARGRLTVEVADEVCPWVAGTWTIEVEGGEGKAARADSPAAIRTDANGLAALFAAYLDPADLAELGFVTGLTDPDIAMLRQLMAGRKPWSPDFY